MNLRTSLGFIIMLLLFAVSCEKPPELPSNPRIEFVSVEFKVVEGGQDSLIVSITFEDGDGFTLPQVRPTARPEPPA